MNKKVKGLIFSAVVICLAGLLVMLIQTNEPKAIKDIKKIAAQETYTQADKEYIVYFWQEACSYCKQIENVVLEYTKTGETPLYIVDMGDKENAVSWYDWQDHHNKYDKVIGRVEDGKEILDDAININDFINDKDIAWSIQSRDDHKLYAVHQTAYENQMPKSASELEIAGTPTMLKIKEGKLVDYRVGVEEVAKLLKN